MGFPPDMKSYNLYDITKKKFFVSRDVLFFEELYHFHSIKEDGKSISHDFIEQFVMLCPLFDHLEEKSITENPINNTSENSHEDSHGVDGSNSHIEACNSHIKML